METPKLTFWPTQYCYPINGCIPQKCFLPPPSVHAPSATRLRIAPKTYLSSQHVNTTDPTVQCGLTTSSQHSTSIPNSAWSVPNISFSFQSIQCPILSVLAGPLSSFFSSLFNATRFRALLSIAWDLCLHLLPSFSSRFLLVLNASYAFALNESCIQPTSCLLSLKSLTILLPLK